MDQLIDRFERNIGLLGREGQRKLADTSVVVVGCGGLGSIVGQELAFLGVGALTGVDKGELKQNNRNRYVSSRFDDPIPGTSKVSIFSRMVHLVDPRIKVVGIRERLESQAAIAAIEGADVIIGCLDDDGPRHILNEACLTFEKPLIDLASDVNEDGCFGGRVAFVMTRKECLYCIGEMDVEAVRRYLTPRDQLENEAAVYGVPVEHLLPGTGPSVISINGVIASLAVTEFMVFVTGLREPARLLRYRGDWSTVSTSRGLPMKDCTFCHGPSSTERKTQLKRYIRLFA